MNKIARLAVVATFGAGLALSAAGCAGTTWYEDCEVDDQYVNGDMTVRTQTFEADCGYWEKDGKYFLRETLVAGAVWHWYSWVIPGQNSFHPEGWEPPHGLEPPKESSESKNRRKKHTNTKSTPAKSTTKKPVTSGGDQRATKNDSGTTNRRITTNGGGSTRKRP